MRQSCYREEFGIVEVGAVALPLLKVSTNCHVPSCSQGQLSDSHPEQVYNIETERSTHTAYLAVAALCEDHP